MKPYKATRGVVVRLGKIYGGRSSVGPYPAPPVVDSLWYLLGMPTTALRVTRRRNGRYIVRKHPRLYEFREVADTQTGKIGNICAKQFRRFFGPLRWGKRFDVEPISDV